MKKTLLLLLAALMAVACNSNRYTIDGIFTVEDGTPVWLIDLGAQDTLAGTKVTGGQFHFEGKTDAVLYVYIGTGNKRIRTLLEPGNLKVDLDERTSSGTPRVDQYVAYQSQYYSYLQQRNEARKELNARKETLSSADFNAAWDSLNRACERQQALLADSLVAAHPNDLMGALAMADLGDRDAARFLQRREELAEEVRSFYLVERSYRTILALEQTAPGKHFTDYLVPSGNPDGSDVRLSDYVGRGRYILLDHWASWCGPCKREIPFLKRAWEQFHGKKFEIVSIAVNDARPDTEAAIAEHGLPWPQILDAGKIPGEIYGVNAIPQLILFAPDGTILRRDLRGEQILTVLSEILR